MSLLTYEDARPRAKAIRDEISEGAMPPWHADPKIGHFSNERHLTDTERSILLRWAAGGAPKGDPKDQPPIPKYRTAGPAGEPNLSCCRYRRVQGPGRRLRRVRVHRDSNQLEGRPLGAGTRGSPR